MRTDLQERQQQQLQNQPTASYEFLNGNDDLFGSPMPFDDTENGLWSGRFVPPPPRPPFLEETVASDGLTTCDLCTWAMPNKSSLNLKESVEKASEIGWPLIIIVVSVLSAITGAILIIIITKCARRQKLLYRNETTTWSRNKKPSRQQTFRRSNVYTSHPHPADSIRGLQYINESNSGLNNSSIFAVVDPT